MNTRTRVTQVCECCGCPIPCGCDYEPPATFTIRLRGWATTIVLALLLWALLAGTAYLVYVALSEAIP